MTSNSTSFPKWQTSAYHFHTSRQQQTTFEKSVAKGEIAHDEQFLLWPHCFQLYLTIKLTFIEIFQVFVTVFFEVVRYRFVVCEKVLIYAPMYFMKAIKNPSAIS